MSDAAYVAVDWGTSSFRLWLMDGQDKVLAERRSSEGMTTASQAGFATVLNAHLQAVQAGDALPVIICGMAGARQGWVEAGYVDVPAKLSAVLDGAVKVSGETRDIRILPGIAQRAQDMPDVMRGEETQLLGSAGENGSRLVCMPGTHSKWVSVVGETVDGFSSFMTGEVFEALSSHTILKHAMADAQGFDGTHPAFVAALKAAYARPAMFTNLIFTCRSGQLLHGLDATAAAARLSGILIGTEMAGGLSISGEGTTIQLVASGKLQALYEAAFTALDLDYVTIDADVAVRKGLAAAARSVFSLPIH